MQKINVICVGKLKEKFYVSACDEYIKRLKPFCSLTVIEIQEERLPDCPADVQIAAALDKEAERIFSFINKNSFVFAMCIEGEKMSSEKFAKTLAFCAMKGYNQSTFIIGGSHGLSDAVKSRADIRLSMSDMTFPHHFARVMLLEQVYRAFQINNNGKYHK